MQPTLMLTLIAIVIVLATGILATRLVVSRRRSDQISQRLDALLGELPQPASKTFLLPKSQTANQLMKYLESTLFRAGWKIDAQSFIYLSLTAGLLPFLVAMFFPIPDLITFVLAAVLLAAPFVIIQSRAESLRLKFQKQLPNAIDLMISVLKSGHSIPQSVRSVSEEVANPCGREFAEAFQRMNLGQSLPDSLVLSVERWNSFELDLIRRAAALQAETGGSLSELLEKTNTTLRERIQLKTKIQVVTAQSRLSAWIAGLLPFGVAVLFQVINPNYMQPLFETTIGRLLLLAAMVAQVTGIVIMRKMSSLRV